MNAPVVPSITPRELEAYLHQKIPLSLAMQVRVSEITPAFITLEAPLEPNRNHLGTAFGGALHTLPILACYSSLWLTLREAGIDAHVVVKHSEANYRRPVTGMLRAITPRATAEIATAFTQTVRRLKKARLPLTAFIEGDPGKPAVEFSGMFVAVI